MKSWRIGIARWLSTTTIMLVVLREVIETSTAKAVNVQPLVTRKGGIWRILCRLQRIIALVRRCRARLVVLVSTQTKTLTIHHNPLMPTEWLLIIGIRSVRWTSNNLKNSTNHPVESEAQKQSSLTPSAGNTFVKNKNNLDKIRIRNLEISKPKKRVSLLSKKAFRTRHWAWRIRSISRVQTKSIKE